MNVLVTGANGYLGTVLVPRLASEGYAVTSLALPGEDTDHIAQFSTVETADVCDAAGLERLPAADVVIHLAGVIDIGSGHRALMKRVNVQGTRNVAEWCRRRGTRLLYCGSVHAIPVLPRPAVMAEPPTFSPRLVKGLYSQTKAEATRLVLGKVAAGLDAMVALPSGVIGPGERRPTNIGSLIVDLVCGRLTAFVDGQYNFVDVRDVADGITRMLDHWETGGCYILAGHEITVPEMLRVVAGASGRAMPRTRLPYWFVLATAHLSELYYHVRRQKPLYTHYSIKTLRANCRFSIQKAADAFGYSPRPAEISLTDMTRWIMDHFVEEARVKYRPCAFREPAKRTSAPAVSL
ncbi:MAG: NAD-dependent epimerase/dehydratase family protein [Propionibacteriaceae bacterium]|jgi:dihydroflavonol-4-reductase|nr:NAD-dependent epimerase/dehydratase family protein [Propionibacteriaceae bacterium]